MAKNLKDILAKKLAENNQRHQDSVLEADFDEGRQHVRLELSLIDPNPYQPRRSFPMEELNLLASSIAEAGLLQPITVRRNGDRYQLIAGERRLRAHEYLGKLTIESIIVPSTDTDLAVLALAENIDREDLTDYEIGTAIRKIENVFPTKKKLAESLGLNREDMYKYFSFEVLPERILTKLDRNPKLLSRAAAVELKRVVEQYKADSDFDSELDQAWNLLETGQIDQGKLAAYLLRRFAEPDVSRTLPSQRKSLKLARSGQQVGSLSRDDKSVTLKLKSMVISDEEFTALEEFIQQLLAHEV